MDGWTLPGSPFHRGEQALHARLGLSERQEMMGRRMMRPVMPEQHRVFFAQLPYVILGSVDPAGAPWASLVAGAPGFVSTPTERAMRIARRPFQGDPLNANLGPNAPLSLLGIELATRRRNRANFLLSGTDEAGIDLRLTMSFGNCPQYIQARALSQNMARDMARPEPPELETVAEITPDIAQWIGQADTFFVASHNDQDDAETIGGVDVNHRGGKPGFVRVDGNRLSIPDFPGNNAFNTLGNFVVNPRAGLLFVDFETGDLLQMTGRVEMDFDAGEAVTGFAGALRVWHFVFERGHILRRAIATGWTFDTYAPQLDRTGQWPR